MLRASYLVALRGARDAEKKELGILLGEAQEVVLLVSRRRHGHGSVEIIGSKDLVLIVLEDELCA